MTETSKPREKIRDFEYIWENVVLPNTKKFNEKFIALFSQKFNLTCAVDDHRYRVELEKSFHELLDLFKKECYNDNVERRLDFRKISAVLVRALIENKVFSFDVNEMVKDFDVRQKACESCSESIEFNKTLCKSFLINYSLAFYCGLNLLYLTTVERYSKFDEKLAVRLLDNGSFIQYEVASDECESDGFFVNVIMGLARADFRGDKIDMMLLAMILYQYEAYTISIMRGKNSSI